MPFGGPPRTGCLHPLPTLPRPGSAPLRGLAGMTRGLRRRFRRQWTEVQNPPPSGEGDRVFAVEGASRRRGI